MECRTYTERETRLLSASSLLLCQSSRRTETDLLGAQRGAELLSRGATPWPLAPCPLSLAVCRQKFLRTSLCHAPRSVPVAAGAVPCRAAAVVVKFIIKLTAGGRPRRRKMERAKEPADGVQIFSLTSPEGQELAPLPPCHQPTISPS